MAIIYYYRKYNVEALDLGKHETSQNRDGLKLKEIWGN